MLTVRGVSRKGEVKLKGSVHRPTGKIPVIFTYFEDMGKEKRK